MKTDRIRKSRGQGLNPYVAGLVALAANFWSGAAQASDQTWTDSTAATNWLTPTNWSGEAFPGTGGDSETNFDIATFLNTGLATFSGINFNDPGIAGYLSLGAIELSPARNRNLAVQNSSGLTGILRLNGAVVRGQSNVILRQAAQAGILNINGQSGPMVLALGNAVNNVILMDSVNSQVSISTGIINASGVSSANLTISGSGAGTVTLTSANNTYNGLTTVNTGILRLAGNGNIGSGGINIGPQGAFDVTGRTAPSYTYANTLATSGSGARLITNGKAVTLSGQLKPGGDDAAGTLNVTGDLNLAGDAYFDITGIGSGLADKLFVSGQLNFGGNLNLVTSYIPIQANVGQQVQLFEANSFAGSISVSGETLNDGYFWNTQNLASMGYITLDYEEPPPPSTNLTWQKASGTWDNNSANWYDGTSNVLWNSAKTATIDGGPGTISVGNDVHADGGMIFQSDKTISGQTLFLGGSDIDVTEGRTATMDASLSAGAGLRKTGNGVLILGAVNSVSGDVEVASGRLVAASEDALAGADAIRVGSYASLALANDVSVDTEITLIGFDYGGTGALVNTSGSNSVSSVVLEDSTRIQSDDGTLVITGGIENVGAGDDLFFSGSGNISVLGSVSLGTGQLIKQGAGTLTLSGSNFYSGGTSLYGGLLKLIGDGDLGSESGSVTLLGGILDLGGKDLLAGTVSINGGSVVNGTLTATGSVAVNSNGTGVVDSSINGSAGITVSGTGTVTFSGSNSYTGATNVDGGTLQAGSENAYSASSDYTVASGAGLDLNGYNNTVGGLNGGGTVTTGSATLTVGRGTFSGTLSGTGELVKATSGTLTLTGAENSLGSFLISEGTLVAGAVGSTGQAHIRIVDNATFRALRGVSADGGITLESGGTVIKEYADGEGYGAAGNIISGGTGLALGGTADEGTMVQIGVVENPGGNPSSEVIRLDGLDGIVFALVMYLPMNELSETSFLGWWNGSLWVNAIDGNYSPAGSLAGNSPYEMSFQSFEDGQGGWDPAAMVGSWGRDLVGENGVGSVWAVIDHNSEFAIVPEVSTTSLLVVAIGLLALRSRKVLFRKK